ncbi:hypothetical protein AK812_SmicGene11125, partial [Symbiodinium microadriaticum]
VSELLPLLVGQLPARALRTLRRRGAPDVRTKLVRTFESKVAQQSPVDPSLSITALMLLITPSLVG